MSAIARLVVITGPHAGRHFCIREKATSVIGRSPECDIRLCGTPKDLGISRRHCQLYCDPPLVRVQDLHSSNGTYINAERVSDEADEISAALFAATPQLGVARSGDILIVGGTSFRVDILDGLGDDTIEREIHWNESELNDCQPA